MLKAPAKIVEFIDWVEPQVSVEVRNSLAVSVGHWHQYLAYLAIILPRAEAADAAYHEVTERLMESARAATRGVARSMTPAEQAVVGALELRSIVAHLEIESFYVFAKILLDRVADSMARYFGLTLLRHGSSHSELQSGAFKNLCARRTMDGRSIQAMLDDLRKRIVDHRTKVIEHLNEPDFARAILYNPGAGAKMLLAGCMTEPLATLLEEVDSYVVSILAFMQANGRHSIIEQRELESPPTAPAS